MKEIVASWDGSNILEITISLLSTTLVNARLSLQNFDPASQSSPQI